MIEDHAGRTVAAGGNPGTPECVGTEKVKPGESATNNDDVTVENDAESSGNATIDPRSGCGNENSETEVKTKVGFAGQVEGLDGTDTVELSSSNTATVEGAGGTVNVSGGSTVTVKNTGDAGGANMTVNLSSGTTASVGPGSTVTFST